MKYLTKSNDKEIGIRTLEDAIRYFASPLEDEVPEHNEYVNEVKKADSLEEFVEIYNRYSDLLFDGAELIIKEM